METATVNNAAHRLGPPAVTSAQGVIYQLTEITPAMAEHWLSEYNTHNRNLTPRSVDAYAQDMAAGLWRETGDCIKRAPDGKILDGQHRLAAIAKSGVPLRMMVVCNVTPEAQENMDTGRRRTFADVLKLRGEKNCSTLAAVTRRVWTWEQGDHAGTARIATPTVAQLLATLDRHPSLRDSANTASATRTGSDIQSSTLGLCHWLFNAIDPDDCAFFFARLGDGVELTAEHPIYVLRRTVRDGKTAKSSLADRVVTAYVIKAWNYYRDGRSIKLLRYRPGGADPEPFPEPNRPEPNGNE